jgi:thymidylate synthase ThyX
MTTIKAEIVAHSVAHNGKEIVTYNLTYPRVIHAEFMTHRALGRNASSSRAIPVEKIIQQVMDDPYVPIHWGKNQKGMQADQEISAREQENAKAIWLTARNLAVDRAKALLELGIHKQVVNRILEPWHHIKVTVTATEWSNFFGLRYHAAAMPEIRELARVMACVYRKSTPVKRYVGEWHLPYVTDVERAMYVDEHLLKASVARCARTSYMNHDGTAPNMEKDIKLHDDLVVAEPLHASPAEHQARPSDFAYDRSGNLVGWIQYRKTLARENIGAFDFNTVQEEKLYAY